MIDFQVDSELCVHCGLCAKDCPARIIELADDVPAIEPAAEELCYRCNHCFSICPTGALSILGHKAAEAVPLDGELPDPDALEQLVLGRRSVRAYRDENLPPESIDRLFHTAGNAASGMNQRGVTFTVVYDKVELGKLREETYRGLGKLIVAGGMPANLQWFERVHAAYERDGTDVVFRGAPHLVIASAPAVNVTPVEDCLIALTTFELLAQGRGVGTLWNGMAKWTLTDLLPELGERLGVPADHKVGYAMSFGLPAVRYPRAARREGARIVWAAL